MKFYLVFFIGAVIGTAGKGQFTNTPVHDPVIIQQNGLYYVFCTGQGITVYSSPDMQQWTKRSSVFSKAPQWAIDLIPGFRGHIWAPDISYHNGQYYLYYSVSAFGKNTSAIGVATNKTLDSTSADFKWIDHGMVIQSVPGRDMWNAIDPNLITDDDGTPWLVFGSFWNGLKLVKMAENLLIPAVPQVWQTVASRKRNFLLADTLAGDAAIEAPFIFKHDNYFYLFASFDYCCRGENSTYKIVVGRSNKVTGPYTDKEGVTMTAGGGSLLLQGDAQWNGVGHNAVANFNGTDYLVYHAYDAADKGRSKLSIKKLRWSNGWPEVLQ